MTGSNPEGVVTVTFETTDESDMAVKMLNGRIVDGRRLEVSLWDGKTKYKVQETEEERQRRLAAWQNYIKGDSDDEESENVTSDVKKNSSDNVTSDVTKNLPEGSSAESDEKSGEEPTPEKKTKLETESG
ncbi:unnamed protein product [Cylicostephanus goldi]|uniref:RRM domain-containing protein n=1 Tax=Cylicostephanus goldi TaxID=71465 RepID=A0A3P7MXM7_CYLGO|nr:unnamed protein product [Cylicostephanus goldi]